MIPEDEYNRHTPNEAMLFTAKYIFMHQNWLYIFPTTVRSISLHGTQIIDTSLYS